MRKWKENKTVLRLVVTFLR